MAYLTTASGEFTIDPPIPWGVIKDSEFLPREQGESASGVELVLEITKVDTTDGILEIRKAVAVRPTWYDQAVRRYDLVSDTQRLLKEFPGYTFTGRFDCYGSDTGDLWRLEIHNGKATKVQPQIKWPNGDIESMRQ